jgi:hypothetical protein
LKTEDTDLPLSLLRHYDYPRYVEQIRKIGKERNFHRAAVQYAQDSGPTLWPDKEYLTAFKAKETGEGLSAAELPEIISLTQGITLVATGKAFTQFFLMDAIQEYLRGKPESMEIGKGAIASYLSFRHERDAITNDAYFWQCVKDEIFHQAALGKLTLYGFDEKDVHWVAIPANYFLFDLFFNLAACQIKHNPVGIRAVMASPIMSETRELFDMENAGRIVGVWRGILVSKSQLLCLWKDQKPPTKGRINAMKGADNQRKRVQSERVVAWFSKEYAGQKLPSKVTKSLMQRIGKDLDPCPVDDTVRKVLLELLNLKANKLA